MPTQKDVKATRKLKRRAAKVNNRRRNLGKQTLSFKHFYKTSHKRNRQQFESKQRYNRDTVQTPPNKKRKFGNKNTNNKPRNAPLGFGADTTETDADYKQFLQDINESESDYNSDNNKTTSIEPNQPEASQLTNENETITQKIQAHQSALSNLKNSDPEFYKHLTEMNENILSFGDNNQFNLEHSDIDETITSMQQNKIETMVNKINEIDETANDEEVEFTDGGSDISDSESDSDIVETFDINNVNELINEFEQNKSMNALKQMLDLFCQFVEMTVEDKKDGKNKQLSKESISMANNPAFQKLLHYILTESAAHINTIIKFKNNKNKNQNRNIPYRSTFNKYFKHLYIFFSNINDETMQRLYLIHCKALIHIILSLNESIKRLYIKYITLLWSSTSPNVRIDAFIFLYECGKRMNNFELTNLLFKFMYSSYVKICKRVSFQTMPGINFMINCMKEIYLLNPVLTYKDAFKRLRSIAFHVKQSITIIAKHETKNISTKEIRSKKLKQYKLETIQSIYNWRFINIIRLWAKILGSHANKNNSDLYLLVYPFIQICCSVLTITRSAMYTPARMKIIESMIELIKYCSKSVINDRQIYVPLAPYLISIMNNPAFGKKTKKLKGDAMEKEFDMLHKIKIGNNDFGSDYLHYSLLNNGIRLMLMYFENYSYCISFPEIVFPAQVFLKTFLANGNISNGMKVKVKMLSNKLKDNANWIGNKRKNVTFSPKDFDKVNAFLANEKFNELSPLSKFMKSKQFENILKYNRNDNNNENESSNNSNKKMKNKNKQMKKKKKQKKKQLRQKNKKNKKIVTKLKTTYDKNKNSNDKIITGLGDIVKDFQLSDDEN